MIPVCTRIFLPQIQGVKILPAGVRLVTSWGVNMFSNFCFLSVEFEHPVVGCRICDVMAVSIFYKQSAMNGSLLQGLPSFSYGNHHVGYIYTGIYILALLCDERL